MKRHESRNLSRNRKRIEALNPCTVFSHAGGQNPFSYLFSKFFKQEDMTEDEKKLAHKIKMTTEQKSAKARQQRKRNKI
jgi:hypothetical protein